MRLALSGGYELDDDRSCMDLDVVHGYIGAESYWAKGRTREQMQAAIDHSARVIGLYAADGTRAGFARVVSDTVHFAYLADVFMLAQHRGRGLGVELVRQAVDADPWAGLSWHLKTLDAHELYRKFGFGPTPERGMDRGQC